MIVIDVLRVGSATDRTDAALLGQQLVELSLPHPVPPPQVILPRAAPPFDGCLAARVVARLAIAAEATSSTLVSRKIVHRLDLVAVGTMPMAVRNHDHLAYLTAVLLVDAFRIAQLGALVVALLAVATSAALPLGADVKLS
jgi:hypothetical protein